MQWQMMVYINNLENVDNVETIIKAECGESFTVYITSEGYYGGFGKMIGISQNGTLKRGHLKI